MKLEMGESLIASWLKHEYGCHIVQLNWKPSNFWEDCVEPKYIEDLFKKLRKTFTNLDLEFTTKKMKSKQLILQGEVDCIGVCLRPGDILENENSSSLIVDKVYAVDIAFHENGLNYNGIEETCYRIRKKYIRTALTIYQYLGTKDAEIIFATPKVMNSHLDRLKQIAVDIKNEFDELGFNYSFKLFCNEDFKNIIFDPLITKCDNISDTSELFLRSMKLINLMNSPFSKEAAERKSFNIKENINNSMLAQVTKIKIGLSAKAVFHKLSISNKLTQYEIDNLCSSEYSKVNLGLPFPALIILSEDKNVGFIKGNRRYYSEPLKFNNIDYLLCNHWIEDKRYLLEKWVNDLS